MKSNKLMLAALVVCGSLLAINLAHFANPKAKNPVSNFLEPSVQAVASPDFLEVGKIYEFSFATVPSQYSATVINGKIIKTMTGSDWIYMQEYEVIQKKGKPMESRFSGFHWMNLSQVVKIQEITRL